MQNKEHKQKQTSRNGDDIETSREMIEFLIPLFTLLHARLGRRLRVLDPCHSNGKIIKHYEPYAGWIEFLHSPEMTAGGDFEVSHANLQRFKELNCDIAAFNPPWSA